MRRLALLCLLAATAAQAEAPFEVRERSFDKHWIYELSAPAIRGGTRQYQGMAYAPRGGGFATEQDALKAVQGIAKRRRCTLDAAVPSTRGGTLFRLLCPN